MVLTGVVRGSGVAGPTVATVGGVVSIVQESAVSAARAFPAESQMEESSLLRAKTNDPSAAVEDDKPCRIQRTLSSVVNKAPFRGTGAESCVNIRSVTLNPTTGSVNKIVTSDTLVFRGSGATSTTSAAGGVTSTSVTV